MTASPLDVVLAPGALRVLFQPVVQVDASGARVHYQEALVRGPRGSTLEGADVLFEYVRLRRAERDADRACAAAVLQAASALRRAPSVGLNVHASTLSNDPEFAACLCDLLAAHGLPPERLVVEIVEHCPGLNAPQLREPLDALRRVGVRLALDGLGQGHSNFAMLLDVAPDYLKVDRCVTQGCHQDHRRLAVLESLLLLSHRVGARVVTGGIEDPADLAAARALGVDLFQGFLLGKPVPAAELCDGGRELGCWALMDHLGATGDDRRTPAQWRN